MKTTDLLAIALRIIAFYLLWLVIQTSLEQYLLISDAADEADSSSAILIMVAMAQILVLLLPGLVLLKFPQSTARRLIPQNLNTPLGGDMTSEDLQTAAFCVLGVFFLATTTPDLFSYVSWFIYSLSAQSDTGFGLAEFSINALSAVIQLVIGLLLCFRAQGLTLLLRRLRSASVQ